MLGNGYYENRFVIDATADKETVKERLAFFGLWALGSMLCIVATLVTYFCYKNRKLKQNN